jgi:hypothetical protein
MLQSGACAKPSAKVMGILTLLQGLVMSLPPELRLQLSAALRSWLEGFEEQAQRDFDRQNPPPQGRNTYTTTGIPR